jgi:UDPglucose 6-dehydrogenase
MIHFLGSSHAANHLRRAAKERGCVMALNPQEADVIFISEDTPTDGAGQRDVRPIRAAIARAAECASQMVLTSQVPPGFTRSLGILNIFHQAETLRIIDATARAFSPEYIAVGGDARIHPSYAEYLAAFECPIIRVTWEEAEFSKIAVNMMLAAQVDYTNRMAAIAEKVGANWEKVAHILAHDSRIGPNAYLKPGRWQDSRHLLRDAVTVMELE